MSHSAVNGILLSHPFLKLRGYEGEGATITTLYPASSRMIKCACESQMESQQAWTQSSLVMGFLNSVSFVVSIHLPQSVLWDWNARAFFAVPVGVS